MAIRRALKRGAEMIVVSSSQIDLQRPEDLWLDARRGTAGIIYATILAQLLEQDPACDNDSQMPGLQCAQGIGCVSDAERQRQSYPASMPQKSRPAPKKLQVHGKVVAVYDLDETLERATDDLRGLAQLLMITGHLGRPGEGLLLLRSDCNSVGAKLAGIDNPLP